MDQAFQEEICAEISTHFGVPIEQLQPEATMASLNIDSLSMIEFLFEMEDKYGISLAESREPLKTLGDVFKEIDKAIAAKKGAA
jgi:acyl carrier protein